MFAGGGGGRRGGGIEESDKLDRSTFNESRKEP